MIFSLGVNSCNAVGNIKENIAPYISKQTSENSIIFDISYYRESAVVSTNHNNYELYALKSSADDGCCIFENGLLNNTSATKNYKIYNNKYLLNKSHNISINLKNTICTRAP